MIYKKPRMGFGEFFGRERFGDDFYKKGSPPDLRKQKKERRCFFQSNAVSLIGYFEWTESEINRVSSGCF